MDDNTVPGGQARRFKHVASLVSGQAKEMVTSLSDSTSNETTKRRCVSTACIACRKRKSKCDGSLPACAACSSVYHTKCEYDPNSDHRRKGGFKKETDHLKTRASTLRTLIQAILNYPQDEVADLVQSIRVCDSLDNVAELVAAKANGIDIEQDSHQSSGNKSPRLEESTLESQLSNKFGELILDDGTVRFVGGTSNLLFGSSASADMAARPAADLEADRGDPIISWTTVTSNATLIQHLLDLYFSWHYSFFTILSKELFLEDFYRGNPGETIGSRKTYFCTPMLVNAILALACHFSSLPGTREDSNDSTTAGDHFFKEAKRIMTEDGEFERPSLASVQALSLMSVREAGCARESKGWIYSGMAFRMSYDLGLNLQPAAFASHKATTPDEKEEDARRVAFWGCFLIDKCWSNYLGRLPTFSSSSNTTAPKMNVLPTEDSEFWRPVSDTGSDMTCSLPSRTRTISLRILELAEISGDLVTYFYHPQNIESPPTKKLEMKRLSEIHTRLEKWKRELPNELEAKDGQLPSVLVMHMFFHLLYIHLFRPFLKYNHSTSPLPSNVSPRRYCTKAAISISRLLRLYKRTHGLRKIVNISVYIAHSACTIHLLNLPDKAAQRDFIHTVRNLDEVSESWLCARRTLRIISSQARMWNIEIPKEAAKILAATDSMFGATHTSFVGSPVPIEQALITETTRFTNQKQRPAAPISNATANHQPHRSNFDLRSMQSFPEFDNTYIMDTQNPTSSHRTPNKLSAVPSNTNLLALSNPNILAKTPLGTGTAGLEYLQNSVVLNNAYKHQLYPPRSHEPYPSKKRSLEAAKSDDMFGGVQALLRDGHDWWMKDQSQLASGLGNWGFLDNSQPYPTYLAPTVHSQEQSLADWQTGDATEHIDQNSSYLQDNGTKQPVQAQTRGHSSEAVTDSHSIGSAPMETEYTANNWC